MDEVNFDDFEGFTEEEIAAFKQQHTPAPITTTIDPNAPRKSVYVRLATGSVADATADASSAAASSSSVVQHPLFAEAKLARIADGSELWDTETYTLLDIFEKMNLMADLPNMLLSVTVLAIEQPSEEVVAKAKHVVPPVGANILEPEYDIVTLGNDTLFEIK